MLSTPLRNLSLGLDNKSDIVFDWAQYGPHRFERSPQVTVNDETLRDGLQSPSVCDPSVESKIQILHLMESLGIEHASMGIPCSGPRQNEAAIRLCHEIADCHLKIRPNCGGRTMTSDVTAIVEVSQRTGVAVEACLFIGSSPLRQYVEGWDIEQLRRHTEESTSFAVREGLDVLFITEDSVRSSPQHLEILLRTAIDAGAARVCLCDTAGSEIPEGTRNLVGWVKALLDATNRNIGIDWHGHRDRGLGLANTLAAIQSGASRVHGTVLGVGERVGNTATEEILVNLTLLGLRTDALTQLPELVATVAEALGVVIPPNRPIVGRDAFRTATGVHAAAVAKAHRRGDTWLADRVYSGVPASWLGRRQEIEIGPLSGRSNVRHFLRCHDRAEDATAVTAVLDAAKRSQRILTDSEILAILNAPQEHE